MDIGWRTLGLVAIAAGGVVAAAYTLGQKDGARSAVPVTAAPTTQAAVAPTATKTGALEPGAAMPGSHSSLAQGPAPTAAVERAGTVSFDPSAKFVHFRVGNRNVKDIYGDGKIMWVGTSGGLIRYDTGTDQFKLFDATNGLLSNGVFRVGKLDGRIVVGTYGGGMSIYDEPADRWETYNVPDGLGDGFVYDVLKARNGDVWIATWSGVNRVRGGALKDRAKWDLFTVDNTKKGLPNDWVYRLAEGKNGDVWLATEGGLALYRNGKWQNWNHARGLGAPFDAVKADLEFKNDPAKVSSHHAKQKQEMGLESVDTAYNPNYIVSLVVDGDGVVWAGTWGGGLARFDGRSWRNFTARDGLPGNHVFMQYIDANGVHWIGTNNGLARRDGERFRVFTPADGLFARAVFSMASGPGGSLWVGSFGGVARLTLR